MVKAIEAARKAARRAQEATYEGVCTIIEYRDVTDEKTRLTSQVEVTVIENQPCKLLRFLRVSSCFSPLN